MKLRGVLGLSILASAGFGATAGAETLVPGPASATFTVTPAVSGLSQPTSFAFLPDGRLVITDKGGDVLLADSQGATTNIGAFQVDSASEKGLLHVILHPDFATNRTLIFYYSLATSAGGTDLDRHRVVSVKLDATFHLDMTTETILVRGLRGPANHDGGGLAIGPDGKLYIGVGDTGCNSGLAPVPIYAPTNYFATCLTNGNGKILRVNLDGSIPSDNPLVGVTAVTACGSTCGTDVTTLPLAAPRTDIWAWGFRNPWRFWFDPRTSNLWVGDVGEVTYEEVDVISKAGAGKHYGWPWREGGQGHPVSACQAITPNAGDCIDPQTYYQHEAFGNAIIGGVIVDSCRYPASYRGKYFFGDSSGGWVATLDPTPDRAGIVAGSKTKLLDSTGQPVHLELGPEGDLYYSVIGQAGGTIQHLSPISPAACSTGDSGSAGGAANGGGGSTGGSANGGVAGAGGVDASVGGAGTARSRDSSSCGCRVGARAPEAEGIGLLGLTFALVGTRRLGSRRSAPVTSRRRRS